MKLEPLHLDLLTIAGEVVAVVILITVVGWIAGRLLGWITAVPALKRLEPGVRVLRQNIRLLLMLAALLACAGVIGGNAWLMYKGHRLPEFTLAKIRSIPAEFWTALAIGAGKSLGLVVVTAIVLRLVRRALDFCCARAKAFEGIKANDESIEQFFAVLARTVRRAAWLYVLAVVSTLMLLPVSVHDTIMVILRIYLIIAAGVLAWRSLDATIASLDALSRKYSSARNLMRFYDRLSPLIPALRKTVELIIYVIAATYVVKQVEFVASLAAFGPRLIRILGIIFISRVVVEVANLGIEEFLVRRAKLSPEQRQRRLTIVPLIKSILKYIIFFSAGIIIIKALGFDPTPVLAGAGILGLAVGLGAQNLINDIVSGFFILFENYYLVGDFVQIGDAEGDVEAIELRATRIRDRNGSLHIIRNGQIDNVINYSKQYTYAVVEVGVAYESDLEQVVAALEAVGDRIRRESDDVLEATVVQGLDGFGESELSYRTVTKVKPGRHLSVERAMRRLIKDIFDERGIEIPYARRVLILPDGAPDGLEAGTPVPVT